MPEEDKIRIRANIKQLELESEGFKHFLGSFSMIDPKLKAMIKTMDFPSLPPCVFASVYQNRPTT